MGDRDLFSSAREEVWGDQQWGVALSKARRIFNPSRPIDEDRLFSGRLGQVNDLLKVVWEGGAHAIIFGERGVGKSSLANTVASRIPPEVTNIKFVKSNCTPDDTFFTLWSKMLFSFRVEGQSIPDVLKDENRTFIVHKLLETLPKATQFVFVFDEFDRIVSYDAKVALADTIKYFSDYPTNITIVILGVGFSIEELFGAHPSIQRCCRQIPIPRMSKDELNDIIIERYAEIGIGIGQELRQRFVDLSQGLPGFVHLSGREAAVSCLSRRHREIDEADYDQAIRESVRTAQESVITAYNKAVYSAKQNIYKDVLLACALAKTDDRGKFSASDIKDALTGILQRPVLISSFARHLAAFCEESRGPILRKIGKPKRHLYQFIDAPLQPYVVMMGKRDGLI